MKKTRTDEFVQSLLRPVKTDLEYRRIVATAEEARQFYLEYQRPEASNLGNGDLGDGDVVELAYALPRPDGEPGEASPPRAALAIAVQVACIEMMHAWVEQRSDGFTLEVQGRFLAKRHPRGLLIDDFVPLPSFCQSLAYETEDADDRQQRFGKARMRTISMDDWKPTQTQFYTDLGIFAEAGETPIDPFKVPIPFHSHYLRSHYQHGPSPGDYDRIYHLKWLYAPASGKNILYSGVLPLSVEVPHGFAPIAAPDDEAGGFVAPAPLNVEDCRVIMDAGSADERWFSIAWDGGLSIGRDESCTVTIDDPEVSRLHARLTWGGAGQLLLEDLSEHGTVVGDERLSGAVVSVERPSELVIGRTRLTIRF